MLHNIWQIDLCSDPFTTVEQLHGNSGTFTMEKGTI